MGARDLRCGSNSRTLREKGQAMLSCTRYKAMQLGYNRMKDIMAEESSGHDQGVPNFEFSAKLARQPMLISLSPLAELEESLLEKFAESVSYYDGNLQYA